jgi:lauroyl/myristoyl acyltransferase
VTAWPRPVPPRIDAVDPDMAKVFGEKSGMERLRIAHEAWAQARERLIAFLTAEHPEWDPEQVRQEVARRLLGGSD